MCRTCSVEGCNNKHYGKGYCNKHYQQIKKHGTIFKSYRDQNDFVVYDDYAEIILRNRDANEVARGKIDIEDIEKIKKYKWSYDATNGYVVNSKYRIRLNRYLMNCPDDLVVDHINHDKLDNRKNNLRICTKQQNNFNRAITNNKTSGITGVSWEKGLNKWRAYININGEREYLGCFNTIEEATEARKQAEIEYFGEYAPNIED
jgi:hypothetical protein